MSVAITVREVPDAVRDELAARAARSGKSMQEYLRALLVEQASKPAQEDLIARVRERVRLSGSKATTQSILAARDAERR